MCGVIATECKTEGCNGMARIDLWCWKCINVNKKYRGE